MNGPSPAVLEVAPLVAAELEAARALTFPAYRPRLEAALEQRAPAPGWQTGVLGARCQGALTGLLLYSLVPETDGCRRVLLHSLAVQPAWRRQGQGLVLLAALEAALPRPGRYCLEASYTTRMPGWRGFEACLERAGWPQTQPCLLLARAHGGVLAAPWVTPGLPLPEGFEFFPWSGLTGAEASSLEAELERGDIPRGLSPFAEARDLEPEVSVGIRALGRVVAWMTVLRSPLMPDALCYRSLFVRPGLRMGRRLGPLALAEAIRRHLGGPLARERPLGVFGISRSEGRKMLNFFERRLLPYCFEQHESRLARKELTPV